MANRTNNANNRRAATPSDYQSGVAHEQLRSDRAAQAKLNAEHRHQAVVDRESFASQLLTLAKVLKDELRVALIENNAEKSLKLMHKLGLSFGIADSEPVVAGITMLNEQAIEAMNRGDIRAGSDEPFGGIGHRRDKAAKRIALRFEALSSLKFICPKCNEVKLNPREWVIDQQLKRRRRDLVMCKVCWNEWLRKNSRGRKPSGRRPGEQLLNPANPEGRPPYIPPIPSAEYVQQRTSVVKMFSGANKRPVGRPSKSLPEDLICPACNSVRPAVRSAWATSQVPIICRRCHLAQGVHQRSSTSAAVRRVQLELDTLTDEMIRRSNIPPVYAPVEFEDDNEDEEYDPKQFG